MKRFFIWSYAAIIGASVTGIALGGDIKLSPSGPAATTVAGNPGEVFSQILRFGFLIGGLLAFGAIVYGAFKYTTAAGNPSGQTDAKDQIWSAVIGLLLLLGSVLILRTINPVLKSVTIGGLSALPAVKDSTCAVPCGGINEKCGADGQCHSCDLICDPEQGQYCGFSEDGVTPSCLECPPVILANCQKAGLLCKWRTGGATCQAAACGDQNAFGPCPSGQACVNFPGYDSTQKSWYCIPQGLSGS